MAKTPAEELQETLSLINPNVASDLRVVSKEQLGQPELFHIAATNWEFLVPNISKRAADEEDNTVPRIHTAPTLMGCIRGYSALFCDIREQVPGTSEEDRYKGGYYLFAIPFDYALKPSAKILRDIDETDEHWLIAYNQATRTYKPSKVGRLVNSAILIEPTTVNGGKLTETVIVKLDLDSGINLHLDRDIWIEGGYWELVLQRTCNKTTEEGEEERDNWTHPELIKHYEIDSDSFEETLAKRAASLSMENRKEKNIISKW